ncbi:NasS protein [Sulfitobacter noctilucicola]|uniref:NitT/TauT family transport system ATP-binding protein n=1 Tax=Sulfitobacter noctilucicola TaxID=1342301 RepID=A0A7W6M6I2_9RHOB|nr:ABC transporter substrate-binding protein [Sulfitobacter noctilucicola]KIN62204.1 NasS protein [Sulfitobacter noctilucicola]MBB4173279.1 NitT/TauT family transport system ATP-binding protein [Sulfitobacter noctilucicola]
MTSISIGYVPLLDAAPLIIAQEMGFAREEGLDLILKAAPSWSSVRDMLNFGAVDAAHMLAPLPIASALDLGAGTAPFCAVSVLSMNGTVIGVSNAIAEKLQAGGHDFGFEDASAAGTALIAATPVPLRIGVPFPFSMHAELLIYWLSALGLPAPQNVDIRTVPPSSMADALAADEIDAFCVGEPWGSLVVEQEVGHLLLPCSAIWQSFPEKVLAMRTGWAEENPVLCGKLIRSLVKAAAWLAKPTSPTLTAEMLSRPDYLNLSWDILERALTGHLVISPRGERRNIPDFLAFHRGAATFPWRSQAEWIGLQLARRTGLDRVQSMKAASKVFRPDIYRAALDGSGMDVPGASSRVEGALSHPTAVASAFGQITLTADRFFDGRVFDPSTPE